jgi:uncharacterized protein (TIGR03084 family)
VQVEDLCADLAAEHAAVDAVVEGLADDQWDLPTPAEGWAIRNQIGHLTFYDRAATRAIVDPDGFAAWRDEALGRGAEYEAEANAIGVELTAAPLLATWRHGRADLLAALRPLDPRTRLAWYGPPMSARSFATARLMETWAHGQDVVDALGVDRPATDRLRHVAHLGVVTRGWSYAVRGLEMPAAEVRVALDPPSGGDAWTWGPEGADDRVTGTALDFCLVVTQRRHIDDTALVVIGPAATDWMRVAQAFAGPPGTGRAPSAAH